MSVDFKINIKQIKNRISFKEPQKAAFTSSTHIYVSGKVNVNGKEYTHHTHLFRNKEGNWVTATCNDILLYRGFRCQNHTSLATQKAKEFFPQIFTDKINKLDDLDEMLADAQKQKIGKIFERQQQEVEKLKQKLKKAEQELLKIYNDWHSDVIPTVNEQLIKEM